MKEKKQMMVSTSFGPVPYDAVKKYLPEKVVKAIDSLEKEVTAYLEDSAPSMCIGYYIMNLAKKEGWTFSKMSHYLKKLWDINHVAAFTVILREVAIELDKKYEDHIDKCEEVFVISTVDGRIHKMPRAYAKNFRNFAAFRTENDAKIACRILKGMLKEMFKSGK